MKRSALLNAPADAPEEQFDPRLPAGEEGRVGRRGGGGAGPGASGN